VKSPATRHERTTDLAKKRARWVKVKERFDLVAEDVERRVNEVDEVDDEEEDDDDGTWEGIGPASERKSDIEAEVEVEAEAEAEDNIVTPETTNALRQRHRQDIPAPSSTAITATGTSVSQPKATLTTAEQNNKEATLSTHRAEQETLTTSLLSLAGQLKASSEAFQTSLEHEKGILNRAVEGLDRNLSGMDAAGKRMGVLRRMSEGRGWWGRMLMYAWIFGLWIVALAIVYLGPKLRF
jgi:Membrane fusion protein Use1